MKRYTLAVTLGVAVLLLTVIYPALLSNPGTQLFSLSGDVPTFIPGTYNFVDVAYGTNNSYGAYNLATVVIATPEPSAVLLLLTGFVIAAAGLTLRKALA